MPARPSPSAAPSSYSKSLPPPPPSSPLKPSTALLPTPSSSHPLAASAAAAAASSSSRPSTPAKPSVFAPAFDDSPVDDRGRREAVRRRAYFADVVLPRSASSSAGSPAAASASAGTSSTAGQPPPALSDELAFLLSTLGDALSTPPFPPGQDESSNPRLAPPPASTTTTTPVRMQRADSVDPSAEGAANAAGVSRPDPRKLEPLVAELLSTERSYVRRLRALKVTYADELRKFAKGADTVIVPKFHIDALFNNADALLATNEAFLADLERAAAPPSSSSAGAPGIGDVALLHFKHLRAFDCYTKYYDGCAAAQAMYADMYARREGFATFVDRSKQKTSGLAGVGLKELLMEPVQRIPRYTMLWALMVRYMDPLDPQRARLLEAAEVARAIAASEKDEVTRRGMVLMGLAKSIEGFPAELINNNRDYLSSLDVDDLPLSAIASSSSATDPTSPAATASSSSAPALHATFILFSDRLLLAKRPSKGASGRRITGLDDLPRLWKGGSSSSSSSGKRSGTPGAGGGYESDGGGLGRAETSADRSIACKGLTSLTDVVAVDLGGPSFSLSIPHPLSHASSSATNWTRPSRHLTVCHPSSSSASKHPSSAQPADARRAKADKQRFLANLWAAQGLVRARRGGCWLLIGREEETFAGPRGGGGGGGGGAQEKGRGYLNVWKRDEWEDDPAKAKVVVQVDESGSDAFLGWDADGMRRVQLVVKVQPLAGGLSRVGVRSREAGEERDEILPTTGVYSHLLQTIHRFGIYVPRPDPRSAPPTPTSHLGSTRRPILGLDALSRNLFGANSSRGGDFALGSSISHKRTRSATSKASSSNATTSNGYASSITRSTVSSLAGSKLSDAECDAHARLGHHHHHHHGAGSAAPAAGPSKSPTSPHRRSPGAMSRSGSTSPFSTRKPVPIDEEMSGPGLAAAVRATDADDEDDDEDDSDGVLGRQLELARKNSENAKGSKADHEAWARDDAQSIPFEAEPPREIPTRVQTPPLQEAFRRAQTPPADEALRRAKSPPAEDDVFGSLRSKSPGIAAAAVVDRRPHGPRALTPSRATTPSSTTTPSGSTAPLRRYAPTLVADRAMLGHGGSSSAPANQPGSTGPKSARSRRVSDEWRNARPSAVAAVPTTTPGPFEDAPESPSSVSSGQKRERRGSVDEPSPVLDKKIRTTDGRSPLSPIRNGSTAAPQLPPVTGLSIRKSSLPGHGPPAPASRKVSGAGVTKRNFEAEKQATSAQVEDRILGAARATQEDVSDSRRSTKRIKLEVEGLRTHTSKNIGQKDRLQRVGETGALPRSPPSRNISIRASNRIDEVCESASVSESSPASSSSSSRPSSSRKAGVDVAFLTDWCAVLEGLIGELEGGLARAAVNSDRLSADVMGLIEAKRLTAADTVALKAKLEEAKQQLEQAHRLAEAQKLELLDAKNENAALYEAFNEELEQMYADMTLPGAEANFAMKRDLQMTKADRNALRLENATLKRELEHAAYEKERYARILRDRGLLN